MKISYEQEQKLIYTLSKCAGLSDEHSQIMAREVSYSDMTGVYSHGISRFANYYKHNRSGIYNAHPDFRLLRDSGNAVVLDNDNATGVLGVQTLYNILRERVRKYGIVMGTALNSTNIGCGAFYCREAVEEDLVAVLCANTSPLMAPFGGSERIMGSNPLAVGIPAGEERPLILDMATTIAAFGKVQAARREGKPIPLGWALDKEGNPTTDPNAFGTLMPFGGAKGYCLAVIIDVFASIFSGAGLGHELGFTPNGEIERSGFCMVLIDPTVFRPLDEFKANVDSYIRDLKGSNRAPGVSEIFMPGEIELRKYDEYTKTGVELPANLCAELAGIAVDNGIAPAGATLEEVIAILDKQ